MKLKEAAYTEKEMLAIARSESKGGKTLKIKNTFATEDDDEGMPSVVDSNTGEIVFIEDDPFFRRQFPSIKTAKQFISNVRKKR
jgi:hypothetical protein